MNNFNFLNKLEISYIFNNPQLFGKEFIDRLTTYCESKKYSISEIKTKNPNWEEYAIRIEKKIKDNTIFLTKTEKAKKMDKLNQSIILVFFSIFFLIQLYTLAEGRHDLGFWMALFWFPIFLVQKGYFFIGKFSSY